MVRQGRRSSRAESGVSTRRLVALLHRPEEGEEPPDGAGYSDHGRWTAVREVADRENKDPEKAEHLPVAGTVAGRTRWRMAGGAVLVVLAVVIGGSAMLLLQSAASQQQAQNIGGAPSPRVAVPAVTGSPSHASGHASAGATSSGSAGGPAPGPAATADLTAAGSTSQVLVHVAGAVVHPGIVELPPNSRVYQAIQRAGGESPEAALDAVNLAAFVQDGEQLIVPTRQQVDSGFVSGMPALHGPPGSSGPAAGGATGTNGVKATVRVNLNTATAEDLATLPRVGPVMAQRIIAWRSQHGKFTSVQELDAIDGVGPKMLESLLPLVTV